MHHEGGGGGVGMDGQFTSIALHNSILNYEVGKHTTAILCSKLFSSISFLEFILLYLAGA
jgi:hypothetical protein